MKKILVVIVLLITIVFMLFYGGYYLLFPSLSGEEILSNYKIPYPTIIAHRGSSYDIPESTRLAYEKAVEDGVDYLEADLQLTEDNKIIIFHDKTLKTTSNIKDVYPERVNEEIGNFTLKELKKLDIGVWFNKSYPEKAKKKYKRLEILTLEELIDISRSGKHFPGLVLELKQPEKYDGIEEKIVEILNEKGVVDFYLNNNEIKNRELEKFNLDSGYPGVQVGAGPARVIFSSFDLNSLKKLKELAPGFPRLLLINDNSISNRKWGKWLNIVGNIVNGVGTKGWTCWPWNIAAAHDRGLFTFPYTINKNWQMKILAHFKADGYITDRPGKVLKFLKKIYEFPEINKKNPGF